MSGKRYHDQGQNKKELMGCTLGCVHEFGWLLTFVARMEEEPLLTRVPIFFRGKLVESAARWRREGQERVGEMPKGLPT